MSNWKESFGDVLDIVDRQQGIFDGTTTTIVGSSALNDYAKAPAHPTPNGLLVSFTCENCGRPTNMVAEYPELISIKYGVQPQVAYPGGAVNGQKVLQNPTAWGFHPDHHMWYPDAHCRCGWSNRPLISIQEAVNALTAAVQRGWIQQQLVNELSNYCHQVKQRVG